MMMMVVKKAAPALSMSALPYVMSEWLERLIWWEWLYLCKHTQRRKEVGFDKALNYPGSPTTSGPITTGTKLPLFSWEGITAVPFRTTTVNHAIQFCATQL